MVSAEITGALLAASARTHGITGVIADLLTHPEGQELYRVAAPPETVGQTVRHAMEVLKDVHDSLLVGLFTDGGCQVNPPSDTVIAARRRAPRRARTAHRSCRVRRRDDHRRPLTAQSGTVSAPPSSSVRGVCVAPLRAKVAQRVAGDGRPAPAARAVARRGAARTSGRARRSSSVGSIVVRSSSPPPASSRMISIAPSSTMYTRSPASPWRNSVSPGPRVWGSGGGSQPPRAA